MTARAVERVDLEQGRLLARPQRTAARPLPVPEERGGRRAVRRRPQPTLVPRARRRGQERPGQLDQAVVGQRAEPAQEARPALGRRELADGARAARELVQQVQLDAVQPRVIEAEAGLTGRRHLGDQLEALEHARREHRPDHRRERREVAVGEVRGEPERQRWQERAVAPHPGGDRLQLRAVDGRTRPDHDPDRLPAAPAERHEDGLPHLDLADGRRNGIGVGAWARARGRVDRHLDERRVAVRRTRELEHRGHARCDPAQMIRIRRSPLRRFSCAMIASISAAVRSISPVSFTTTWS